MSSSASTGPVGALREAFLEGLAERGLPTSEGDPGFAADLAQLAVRALGRGIARDPALASMLRARAGLSGGALELLLELLRSPRFGQVVQRQELRAFGDRFGPEALDRLSALQAQLLDFGAVAPFWSPERKVALLDSLFELSRTPKGIPGAAARALGDATEQLGLDGLISSRLFAAHDPRHSAGSLSWRLVSDRVTVGSGPGNEVVLPDPMVARHHCTLLRSGGRWRVVDSGSGRPLLLDGRPITSAPLVDRQELRVGPWRLSIAEDRLWAHSQRSFDALSVRGLTRRVEGRVLLDRVDFTVFPGELVALVGPSGAGKTTLIHTLSGLLTPDSGEVIFGSRPFHAMLAEDPSLVGFVPQDDLLHGSLTVEESLFFAGRLRYGGRVSDGVVARELERVLAELGIAEIRGQRVGDELHRGISGGQRKRVNLGQELMTRSTRVLFLDEPTSGLDPRSAQDIVRQVRLLADRGRTVFLVTHDLSPSAMAQVDHLLILVPGGQLAWFGPPRRACRYFDVSTPDLIFERLEERAAADWAARWRASEEHRALIECRSALLDLPGLRENTQRLSSADLNTLPDLEERRPGRVQPSGWTQWHTLCLRYMSTRLRDSVGMAVLALQPMVLALLIWLVFPVPSSGSMFMLSLSCLWFGMSGSVRELIADRAIFAREHKVGVGLAPYLGSKLTVLAALHAGQCALFTSIVYFMMGLGDYGQGLVGLSAVQVLTGLVGVCLGLMVSSMVDSSEAAVGSLPLLLIPNICFSSVLVSLRDMGIVSKALTAVSIQRYAFDLSLKMGTHLGEPSRIPGEWDRVPVSGPLYELGLKPAAAADMGLSVPVLVAVLFGFGAAFFLATWLRLRLRLRLGAR